MGQSARKSSSGSADIKVRVSQPEKSVISLFKVLVIDAEKSLFSQLRDDLVRQGCEVDHVESWRDSIRIFQSKNYDVVFADRSTPMVDGIDLCQRMRRLDRHVHIILVANAGDEAAKNDALRAGVDDLLLQPFSAIDVALAIAAARRVVQMQRRLSEQNKQLSEARMQLDRQLQDVRNSLQSAAQLQRGLLPAPIRNGPYRLESFFLPSQEIGGDVLGAQQLDNGKLLFFNLDVAGHGIHAALEAFALHSRLAFPPPDAPDRLQLVVQRLNAELLSRDGSSATVVMGLLDRDGAGVTLLRAGHPPPLLIPRTGKPRFVDMGGLPLGLFNEVQQPLVTLGLSAGDRLLVYSDGVTDGDGDGGGIGPEGLVAFWTKMKDVPLSLAVGKFESDLRMSNRGQHPADDLSVLIIERA